MCFHDENPIASVGDTFNQGDLFAHTGTAGGVTGDHTHFNCANGQYAGWEQVPPQNHGQLVNSTHIYDICYVNDTVIFGSSDGNIYCLNESDGSLNWKVDLNNKIIASPTVDEHDNSVYSGSDEGNLTCIDIRDGTVKWSHFTGDKIQSTPALKDNLIAFGCNNGYLYEVNIDDKHKTNLPTEKGMQLGITVNIQQNSEGQDFQKVLYDISALRFMLNNIESIALFR